MTLWRWCPISIIKEGSKTSKISAAWKQLQSAPKDLSVILEKAVKEDSVLEQSLAVYLWQWRSDQVPLVWWTVQGNIRTQLGVAPIDSIVTASSPSSSGYKMLVRAHHTHSELYAGLKTSTVSKTRAAVKECCSLEGFMKGTKFYGGSQAYMPWWISACLVSQEISMIGMPC